jgi:signal transduction histidine kinase
MGSPAWLVAIATGAAVAAAMVLVRRAPARDAAPPPEDAAELRRALKRRDEQLAHTAHELRTPLTSVITALEMLREGYASSPDETEEFLDQATLAARHLAFLVNDVLDLAALSAGRVSLNLHEHSVQGLLGDADRVMGLHARSHSVHLAFDRVGDDLVVYTDHRRFLQIVFNLVGNAVKFSTAGESVRFRVEAGPERVRFLVVDNGPGVPLDVRNRLFLPFGRAEDGSAAKVEGTGLGLHVCRLLAERLHGDIGYQPGAERGSVFWFELPVRAPAEASDLARAPEAPATIA